MSLSRREFLGTGAAAAAGLALPLRVTAAANAASRPVVISAANGLRSRNAAGKTGIEVAYDMITRGADPLDAVIAGVNVVELDPTDQSVGLGGLPNEDGIVELDASCMHGPTRRAGAVGAIQDIATPSLVAKAVMDYTDHIFLVGEGARRFALEMGFKPQNLLTEQSREAWHRWKANLNPDDNWLDMPPVRPIRPPAHPMFQRRHPPEAELAPEGGLHIWYDAHGVPHTWGTINMNAVTASGDIASVTTTSGLSWKIPGRVGDSAIIGAGQYCDNDVGAAGSTGRGEANMKACGAFLAVELMRQGKTPQQAVLEVLQRVIATTERRLLDERGRPYFELQYYAVNKRGEYAGGTLYEGGSFAVCDERGPRLEPFAYLYKRSEQPRGRPLSGVLRQP